ncbi:YheC/YheD family protein ['Paenibacillus yunnanensis' Narsing Rao et al. 2020]|uniref:YheC/YheD family endospore coat-associated protein n=1 Tax=Paenibacillus tengchongensis TaxID=2608684 RepID=UPI00124D8DC5|nr:YheC/YheD family protein [Paenibacillus tengchongensis]
MGHKLVGILLNAAMHRGVPRLQTGQESIANYEEAAAAFGLIPCFLKLSDIDMKSGLCIAYLKYPEGYRRVAIPVPAVIHNRAIYDRDSREIEQLVRQGLMVFNTCNRYGKDQIHGLLEQNEALREFLPATASGYAGLKDMMQEYPDLILKPSRGSVGQGVMRLTGTGSGRWNWMYQQAGSRRWVKASVRQSALPAVLRARLSKVSYVVQERIPLAEIDKRPFDLRVTVQRGWGGEWQVTGMFAKLAAEGSFVSNIARGGEALPSALALERAFGSADAAQLRCSVASLSLAVARELSLSLPGLADIGLDIGVTRDKRVVFIECNARDQRYGFRKAGLGGAWKDSYRRPMGYARQLLEAPSLYNGY